MSREAALRYAERGWHVFRLWPGGKTPTTKRGCHDATTDRDQIERWFRVSANIAIAAGPSRLVVLDRDPRNDGDSTLRKLIGELGPLPPTVTSITGSGGGHALFRAPATGVDLVGHLGPGLDVIHSWRYIVAPPSIHPNGERYRWRAGRGPDDIEVAELPVEWLQRIVRPAPAPLPPPRREHADDPDRVLRRARAYLRRLPPAISGSHGHDATYRAAVALVRGFALDGRDALDLLANDFNPACSPPWSERELARKVREAQRARLPHGYLLGGRP